MLDSVLLQSVLDGIDRFVIFELSLVVIAIVAVSFGIVWIVVSFYHFYPYVQRFLVPLITGSNPAQEMYVEKIDSEELPSDGLPTVDVLLPAYKEGNVIHQSIASIRQATYPQKFVNLNVLVEPGDHGTRAALDALRDEYEFREIVVPEAYPGSPNKPRALNYGFESTTGDIVGVIDAEDIIDPDLFEHIYGGLVQENYDYVQGMLDMVNEGDGWKNTMFRAEYAWWFRWLLPAFNYTDYPVPLGGTTNFARRSVLEEISTRRREEYGDPWDDQQWEWIDEHGLDGTIPWDPQNVTEDFELGLFLWKEGYELGLIDSVTKEESPLEWNEWIRQRTRWQKGKIYSFIQYAYHRPDGWRVRFHLFMQSFLPHLAPVHVAGVVILAMVANLLGVDMPIGAAIALILSLVFLIQMNVLHAISYWKLSDRTLPVRIGKTIIVLLTLQLYWLPLWGAEHRAMKQTYANQLHWEKTKHYGRNAQVLKKDSTDHREVVTGFFVLFVGLFVTIGVPVWYFWFY